MRARQDAVCVCETGRMEGTRSVTRSVTPIQVKLGARAFEFACLQIRCTVAATRRTKTTEGCSVHCGQRRVCQKGCVRKSAWAALEKHSACAVCGMAKRLGALLRSLRLGLFVSSAPQESAKPTKLQRHTKHLRPCLNLRARVTVIDPFQTYYCAIYVVRPEKASDRPHGRKKRAKENPKSQRCTFSRKTCVLPQETRTNYTPECLHIFNNAMKSFMMTS